MCKAKVDRLKGEIDKCIIINEDFTIPDRTSGPRKKH